MPRMYPQYFISCKATFETVLNVFTLTVHLLSELTELTKDEFAIS